MEVWKEVIDFPQYEVSSFGRIRTMRGGKEFIKKITLDNKGYGTTKLGTGVRGGVVKKLHRLIAEAFIPNPDNKPTVDHINRVKDDNRLENLRWSDGTEQCVNRKFPKGVTGHNNITLTAYDKHRVIISRYNEKVFDECFDTLEEAIFARDSFLDSL